MRPPYSANEVNFLDSWIEDGLRVLKDVGKTVNYEEMCERMLNSIPNNYFTPEYISYIKYWQERFKEISSKRDRNKKFEEFVKDLSARGFLKNEIYGITANFSEKINKIIRNPTH